MSRTRSNQDAATTAAMTGLTNVLHSLLEQNQRLRQLRQGLNTEAHADDHALERFLRFGPPEYHGDTDQPHIAELWLDAIEDIFAVLNNDSLVKVKFATFKLRGAARDWWTFCKASWTESHTIATWEEFKEAFQNRFLPPWIREQKEDEFLQLKQGSMTVPQYEAKFARLCKFCRRMVNTEEHRVRKFVKGLRYELQTAMAAHPPLTYVVAVEVAVRIEVSRKAELNARQSAKNQMLGKHQVAVSEQICNKKKTLTPQTCMLPKCSYCKKRGHLEAECWKKERACLICGSSQHFKRQCPKARNDTQKTLATGETM